MQYEIVNPSDQAFLDADTDPIAVAAAALIGEGRYAVKRDGFDGPLFLFGGQDEWFREHADGVTFEAFLYANLVAIGAALKTVRLVRERSSMNDIVKRSRAWADAIAAKAEAVAPG